MESGKDPDLSKSNPWRGQIKRWPRKGKWAAGILVLLIIFIFIFIVLNKTGDKPLPVSTGTVHRQEMERVVVANGRLDAVKSQEFFAPVDSILMDLSVKVGDRVTKRQDMGRLDTLELQRNLDQAEAELAAKKAALAKARATDDRLTLQHKENQYIQAQKHLERVETLFAEGAVTAEDLESARTQWAAAEKEFREASAIIEEGATGSEIASFQAQVDLALQEVVQAKERLGLASFISKSDGVVVFVGAEKGNQVSEGTRLLEVANTDALEVTANVNEMDAGSLKAGQPVKIECAVFPEREYLGEVSRVSHAAIETGGEGNEGVSLPVTVKLKGDTEGLKLGYTVDLLITTMKEENSLTVPVEALITQQEEKTVYVVENGTARKRKVETKIGNELYDLVISGVQEGEEIILNPSPDIQDGQKVAVISAQGK